MSVRLPRARRREIHFLSAAEVTALAEATVSPYDTLIYLLAYGGLRWGEAAALRRSRCHLTRSRIEVSESLAEVAGRLYFGPTKTYRRRTVVLPGFLREMLAAHLARHVERTPEALVFTDSVGGPLRNANFRQRMWQPAVAAACLPEGLRIHDLRHTCAALLIARGAHPKAIQAHLGHSSIQVTLDIYGHLFPDEMDRLAEQLDAAHVASSRQIAASVRHGGGAEVIEFPSRGRKVAADQGASEWGGEDSNLRP
ncbi:MAG: tyrosine-type recombinase/integrase, partial [Actinomycetota bacterium]